MPDDDRAVLHYMVPAAPGARGLPSTMPKNAAALPPVLQAALSGTGQKWCFACSPNLRSSLRHHGTGEACLVNCLLCKKTKAWLDAPDDGAFPKDPNKPRDDGLEKFLVEQPDMVEIPAGVLPDTKPPEPVSVASVNAGAS